MEDDDMIALVHAQDAAPLPHLRHLSAEQRRVTAEIGGTPRGMALAADVTQWARNEMARALAVEAQAQLVAQAYGTSDIRYVEAMAQADRFRKRAEALEAEAAALTTTHSSQQPLTGDAYERMRRRIQDSWKTGV